MEQRKHNIIYVLVKNASCAIILDQDTYIYWIIMCFVLHVVNTCFPLEDVGYKSSNKDWRELN